MSIKCKIFSGILYCYDKDKNVVYAYPRQIKELKNALKALLQRLLIKKYDAEIIIRESK
jgi:hypothetical protein